MNNNTNVLFNGDKTNGAIAATELWILSLFLGTLTNYIERNWYIVPRQGAPEVSVAWRPARVLNHQRREVNDNQIRLLRWDQRPPNEIFEMGFIPQIRYAEPESQATNLYGYVRSNTHSIFVSTTTTRINESGRVYKPWTPRNLSGIRYQYEIFAPGGIDINTSFGIDSPFPTQNEIAFPGGIRPQFIRSVRQINNGVVERIWVNPNFIDPGELPQIAIPDGAERINWYSNHPRGNDRNPNTLRNKFNPDEDMHGANGHIPQGIDTQPYEGAQLLANDIYQIKNRKNNYLVVTCLGSGIGSIRGNKNFIFDTTKWHFIYNNDKKAYQIQSGKFPDLYLTLASESTKEVIGEQFQNKESQYWKIERVDSKYYFIVSFQNDTLVLDFKNGDVSQGNEISVSFKDDSVSQKWEIDTLQSFRPIPDSIYKIQTVLRSGDQHPDVHHFVSVVSPNRDYTPVIMRDNRNPLYNDWKFIYDEHEAAYYIQMANTTSVKGIYADDKNRKIYIAGDPKQFWHIQRSLDGYFRLQWKGSNQGTDIANVLDVPNGFPEGDPQLQIYQNNNTLAQKWLINPVNYELIPDGEYLIQIYNNQDRIVNLNAGSSIIMKNNNYKNEQKWRFIFNNTKQAYKIINVEHSNLALTLDGQNIISTSGDNPNQYWRVEKTSDGYFKLRSYTDPALVLDGGIDWKLIGYFDSNRSYQKWSLQRIDVSIIKEDTYFICSKLNYKKVIEENTTTHNTRIWDYYPLSFYQRWKFEYYSNQKAYIIRSGDSQTKGLYYQNKSLQIAVAEIDLLPDQDLKKYWFIEYNNANGCFLIRSAFEPTQACEVKDSITSNGTNVISNAVTFNRNQLWYLIPLIPGN